MLVCSPSLHIYECGLPKNFLRKDLDYLKITWKYWVRVESLILVFTPSFPPSKSWISALCLIFTLPSKWIIHFLLGPSASRTGRCSSLLATWFRCWHLFSFDVALEGSAVWVLGGSWKELIRNEFFTDKCQVSHSRGNNWSCFYNFSVLSLLC